VSGGSNFEDYFRQACVVVTGAASGIGRATARGFADAGAVVVLFDRDVEGLTATERELGGQAVQGDISRWADCLRLRDAVVAREVPLRALVNCAASFRCKGVDATPEDWDESLGVNVRGTALVTSALIDPLIEARGASVVNIASISGHVAQQARWTYCASKGAVLALTRCQAMDLAPHGIRVNSISPGTVWTAELDRMTGCDRERWAPIFGTQHMLGRVGEPEEIAHVVIFISGPGASFMTGADILVDGGYTALGNERFNADVQPVPGKAAAQ
jgi:NAD(P)-dependent dehydrogenase (short-subunit alcohol dehydrogenase family)